MFRLFGIVCLLCCACPLAAQTALQPVAGLPTKEINDLHVDKKGYLWIAHSLGLSRYDGLNFTHFRHPGQVTLRSTDIVEDGQGRIWCHNFSGQVYFVEQGQMKALEAYDYKKEAQFPRMALLHHELLITSQKGLFVYNTLTHSGQYLLFDKKAASGIVSIAVLKDKAVVFNNKDWYVYERQHGLKKLATSGELPLGFDEENELTLQPATINDTLFLTANPAGVLYKLLLRQGALQVSDTVGYNDYINAVTVDEKVWVHTRNQSSTTNAAVQINTMSLSDVVTGKEGNTWYSSLKEGLLVSYQPSHWQLIQFPVGEDDFVRSLNVSEGYFFAGTQKGNLYMLPHDSAKAEWQHNLFNGFGSIDYICYYKSRRFLVGSTVNTYIVNPKEKKVENLLPLDAIQDVEFNGGNLYMATAKGFYAMPHLDSLLALPGWEKTNPLLPQTNSVQRQGEVFQYTNNRTRAVRYDEGEKALFIAGKDGLQRVNKQGMHPYLINGKEVFATSLWYKYPRLYIATINDGLWIKEGNQFQHFTTVNALFSNTILRLKVTGQYLWLFLNTGLQVFDIETNRILQHIDLPVVRGDNIFDVAEKDGFAYLTTAKGIYKVPMNEAVSRPAPQGYLDYVLVNNQDTFFNGGIELPFHKNDVQFFFSSPAFYDPVSLSFKYRLLGAEKDWQVTQPDERMLRYAALEPGDYTFEVKAVNRYGVEQQTPIQFRFTIVKPWWNSTLFLIAVNGLIVFIVLLILRNRVRQRLRVELVRRNISADLHDDIGATLSSVNIYAALAKTEKNNEQYLELIQQHVTDAVMRLDDLVWSINPKNDTMEQLITRMKSTATPLLAAAGIACHFYFDEKVLHHKLNLTQKRHLYLLFKEMLNNVVKHAGCSNCTIRLELQKGLLTLSVSDDGIGFNPEQTNSNRNGMQSMYNRAKKLNGTVKVISANKTGSTLQVQLKA